VQAVPAVAERVVRSLVGPDGAGGAAHPGGQLDVRAVQQGQLAAGVEGAGELAHALLRQGLVDEF
jgi:hypothetical protein